MKLCPKCKQEKPLCEFNKNSNREDGLQRICKICTRSEDKKSYLKCKKINPKIRLNRNEKFRKQKLMWINSFKKEGCIKCGDKRQYVLDFHHLDPNKKDFNVSSGRYGYEKIKEEIEKCIILCRNCHSEFHYLKKEKNINIEQYLKN